MKKFVPFASVLLVSAGCGAANPDEDFSRAAQSIAVGSTFNFGTLAHPGACLDAQSSGTSDGTQMQEWWCNGTGAQSFRVDDAGNGNVHIVNTNASKCVDVQWGGTADGTKIQLWDCNGTGAQTFSVQDEGGGFVSFVNTNSGKCLDVTGDNPADGTLVQLYTCNQTNAQKWNPAVISGSSGGGGGGGGGATGGGSSGGSGNMTVANHCGFTVWAGVLANSGDALPVNGGFQLDPGQAFSFQTAFNNGQWGGRVWGRTGCNAGGAACETGDCGGLQCNGAGGAPPATLAEFTIVPSGTTFYDVSLVDGYNLEMQISAPGCPTVGCTSDLNKICPAALQQRDASGNVVACRSDCEQYNDDATCCRNGPDACHANPPPDSPIFKQACPQAYSYAYDDATSTFTCQNQANYTITFCP